MCEFVEFQIETFDGKEKNSIHVCNINWDLGGMFFFQTSPWSEIFSI
jgi:hypothetical protein